eukprot:GFYU01003503.1.p1 GENE.GFYU01003503.1~~GFYU01003503.1.p1  ORF type:complete len:365 (+),score=65.54 GFYU01003503.1:31-1095(+)
MSKYIAVTVCVCLIAVAGAYELRGKDMEAVHATASSKRSSAWDKFSDWTDDVWDGAKETLGMKEPEPDPEAKRKETSLRNANMGACIDVRPRYYSDCQEAVDRAWTSLQREAGPAASGINAGYLDPLHKWKPTMEYFENLKQAANQLGRATGDDRGLQQKVVSFLWGLTVAIGNLQTAHDNAEMTEHSQEIAKIRAHTQHQLREGEKRRQRRGAIALTGGIAAFGSVAAEGAKAAGHGASSAYHYAGDALGNAAAHAAYPVHYAIGKAAQSAQERYERDAYRQQQERGAAKFAREQAQFEATRQARRDDGQSYHGAGIWSKGNKLDYTEGRDYPNEVRRNHEPLRDYSKRPEYW